MFTDVALFCVYMMTFCVCVCVKKGYVWNQDDVLHSKAYRKSVGMEVAYELTIILLRVLLYKEILG